MGISDTTRKDGPLTVHVEQAGDALMVRASGELSRSTAEMFETELRQGLGGNSDATTEHNVPWAHLRAYLAGVGATISLTSGALVLFLSLATFVTFKGLPSGGWSNAGAASLDPSTSVVAKNAAPGSHAASPAARSAAAAGSGGGDPSGKIPSGSAPTEPGVATSPGDITPAPVAIPSLPSTSGPATDAVQGVDNAAGTNLSGPTGGVTGAVDGAATGALNQAGRAAGRAGLGGQAGGGPGGSLLGD